MPTRRGHTRRAKNAITPEAVDAFVADDWMRLYRALDLRPWQINPIDVDPGDPPPDGGSPWSDSYPRALQLRAELEAAVRGR